MTYPEGRMEQHQGETEQIVPPDLTNEGTLNQWLNRYVDRPFKGYDDLRHPDGTPFSHQEQIEASKVQLRTVADEWPQIGKTPEQIAEHLTFSIQSLREPDERPVKKPNFPLAHK